MSSNKTLLSPAVKRAGRSRARIKKKEGRRHSRGEAKANTRAAAVRVFCRVRSRSRRCGRELQRLYGHLQLHRSLLFSLAVKLERDAQKVKSELAHIPPSPPPKKPKKTHTLLKVLTRDEHRTCTASASRAACPSIRTMLVSLSSAAVTQADRHDTTESSAASTIRPSFTASSRPKRLIE